MDTQRNDSKILNDEALRKRLCFSRWEAQRGALRPPKPPKRLRMDWGKLGKALLIVAGAFAALFVPVLLLQSDNLLSLSIGTALSILEIVLCVAYMSGALEFK